MNQCEMNLSYDCRVIYAVEENFRACEYCSDELTLNGQCKYLTKILTCDNEDAINCARREF